MLIKVDFIDRFLKKPSFHENPSSGSRVVPCGWKLCTRQTSNDKIDTVELVLDGYFSGKYYSPKSRDF